MSSEQLFEVLRRRLTAADSGEAWDELVAGGVTGLRVNEELDGLGMSVSEAEPVMAALGETGRATPFVESSIIAAGLLSSCSSEANETLRRIATGSAIIAVAGIDPRLRSTLSATRNGDSWTLSGRAQLVLHAAHASAILAVVSVETRTSLFLVDSDRLDRQNYPTIDGRAASDITFGGTDATLLSTEASEVVEAVLDEAHACIAIEAAAIMRRLVRDTVGYTRERRQFGQPLSKFQVVQHRLVDMNIQARRASAIAREAMAALDGPAARRSRLVSAAKATASSAGRFVGQQAVQLHGAMGMTEELPLSGLFKRLTVIEDELGSASSHLTRHARLREAP